MSLSEKLTKIQALIDKTSSQGERQAATLAKERLLSALKHVTKEYHITVRSIWQKSLFQALCKKYGLHTFRYPKQKYTTTMVMVSPAFLDDCLWPEYLKYSSLLQDLILEVTETVIEKIDKGVAANPAKCTGKIDEK